MTTTIRKTYSAGSTSIAVRTIINGTEDTLNWLLSDHLGSASITTTADGTWNSELRYSAFGETRYSSGITSTDYRYTGQLQQADINLYYYNARFYDPALGRFVQSDTIVPDTLNILDWDRFGYVHNNPLRYIDPSGHDRDCGINDPYCNSLKHEMTKSDWPKQLDFKKYVAAKDSYDYYQKRPEKAIDADINSDDSFMYASIYSESVVGYVFRPYEFESVVARMDIAKAEKNQLVFWSAFVAAFLQISFESEKGGFGSGGVISEPYILQKGGHTLTSNTLKGLELTQDEANSAIHALKKYYNIGHDSHGIIMSDGGYKKPNGEYIDNLYNFLP